MAHRQADRGPADVLPAAAAGRKHVRLTSPDRPGGRGHRGHLWAASPATAAPSYDPHRAARAPPGWPTSSPTTWCTTSSSSSTTSGCPSTSPSGWTPPVRRPSVVKAVTKAVSKNVAFYRRRRRPGIYAGATAKAAVLADSPGQGPARLRRPRPRHAARGPRRDRRADRRPHPGRLRPDQRVRRRLRQRDRPGVRRPGAERREAAPRPRRRPAFLLEQQCSQRLLPADFTGDKTAADQSCDGAAKAERTPDTDATAHRRARAAARQGRQGQGRGEEGRRVARRRPGRRRLLRRRQVHQGRQRQQHRPRRLGARRDRRDRAGGPGWPCGSATCRSSAQPVRQQARQARRRDRVRRGRLRQRPRASASRRRPGPVATGLGAGAARAAVGAAARGRAHRSPPALGPGGPAADDLG